MRYGDHLHQQMMWHMCMMYVWWCDIWKTRNERLWLRVTPSPCPRISVAFFLFFSFLFFSFLFFSLSLSFLIGFFVFVRILFLIRFGFVFVFVFNQFSGRGEWKAEFAARRRRVWWSSSPALSAPSAWTSAKKKLFFFRGAPYMRGRKGEENKKGNEIHHFKRRS